MPELQGEKAGQCAWDKRRARRTVRYKAGKGQTIQAKSLDFILSLRVTLKGFKEREMQYDLSI